MIPLFLDIDGVLNSEAFYRYEHNRGVTIDPDAWDPRAVDCLRILLEDVPDLRVVISSSKRIGVPVERFKHKFSMHRLNPDLVIGLTPDGFTEEDAPDSRGYEIFLWLKKNFHRGAYIILDDEEDMYPLGSRNLIKIDEFVGLTLRDVMKVKDRIQAMKSEVKSLETSR